LATLASAIEFDPDVSGETGWDVLQGQDRVAVGGNAQRRQIFQFQTIGSSFFGSTGLLLPADNAQATTIAATKST
jgi:hypothetical protein